MSYRVDVFYNQYVCVACIYIYMKYELCLNGSLLWDILPYPLYHCQIRLPVIRVCFTVCLMSQSFFYIRKALRQVI